MTNFIVDNLFLILSFILTIAAAVTYVRDYMSAKREEKPKVYSGR
jgi:hypothetical protein